MDKQQIIDFLKENLKVTLEDDGKFLKVKILLGDEEISECTEMVYR